MDDGSGAESAAHARSGGGIAAVAVVGLALASADLGLTAAVGYRVPADLLALGFGLDLVLVAVVAASLALKARWLLRPTTPRLGVLVMGVQMLLGLETLMRVGLHRDLLLSAVGLAIMGGYALLGMGLLLLLRTVPRRAPWGVGPVACLVLGGMLLAMLMPRLLEGRVAHVHRVQPFAALLLMGGVGAFLQRRLVAPGRSIVGLALVGVAGVAAVSWATTDARPRAQANGAVPADPGDRRPNLLLISLDTLRDDAVGPGPGGQSLTPHLDRLAAEGRRYAAATSPAAWTLPAHASMLTGLYPASHGVLRDDARLPAARQTLAETLREAGYHTLALTGGGYVSRRRGLDQGFEVFDDHAAYRYYFVHEPAVLRTLRALPGAFLRDLLEIHAPFESAVGRVVSWLDSGELGHRSAGAQPWFLFLHTYEAHNYHRQYGWWRDTLREQGGDPAACETVAGLRPTTAAQRFGAEGVRLHRQLYEAGVSVVDAQVGRVLEALRRTGVDQHTVVLVTSDHGEGFDLARDRLYHGGRLHDDLVHVPLILRTPLDGAAPVEMEPVSLVDIAPTLVQLAGMPASATQGRSLVQESSGASTVFGQEAYLWRGFRKGKAPLDDPDEWPSYVRSGTHKLIRSPEGWEAYDLRVDPGETVDLLSSDPSFDPEPLRAALEAFLERQRQMSAQAEASDASAVDEELLRRLGYIKD